MTIEDLTLQSCQVLLTLCDDMRAIADDAERSQADQVFWKMRADTLQTWLDAVSATLNRDMGQRQQQTRSAQSPSSAPPKGHDWIPVKGAVAETGQFAFTVTHGPLAGIPLSIAVHGPDVVLWLARNDRGEMFVRPWEAKDPVDAPRDAHVLGSYRPALLAGAGGGFNWLPIPSSN